ncbi:hypothetical protein [Tautonia marina]|uniref:hypothetical protein n=1 Tax=Tautonia marina TaxID=2653855 RepID=UPI00126127F4|nr:hypothetical protein [Tautonia marina]
MTGHSRESEEDSHAEELIALARMNKRLNRQAMTVYKPVVESILSTDSRDVPHIERTLDGLLGFCGYTPILKLYRRLCRHYWSIDPAAAVEYVEVYRQMWDDDEKEEAGSQGDQRHG